MGQDLGLRSWLPKASRAFTKPCHLLRVGAEFCDAKQGGSTISVCCDISIMSHKVTQDLLVQFAFAMSCLWQCIFFILFYI